MDDINYAYFYLTTTLIAAPLNFLVVGCNLGKLLRLSPSSFLSVSFSLIDCINATTNICFIAIKLLDEKAIETGSWHCSVDGFFILFGSALSLLLCTGLTLFRFMVIVLQKRVFKEHAWVFVCVATAVSGIFALLPPIFRAQYSLQPSKVYCAIEWENRGILAVIIISIGLILTPVGLICFAYVKIYVVMVHSVWDVKRAVSKDEVSKVTAHTIEESEGKGAGAAGATENGTTSHIDDHQKALLVQSMVIVAAFLIGWTPYLILIFWELLTQRVASPLFDFLAVYCVILNQIINPSILFCYNKEIRSNVIACFSNH